MTTPYQSEMLDASDETVTDGDVNRRPSPLEIKSFLRQFADVEIPQTEPVHRWLSRLAAAEAPEGLFIIPDQSAVQWRGADPCLTVGEFRVVSAMAEARGEFVSYRGVYDAIRTPGFIAGDGDFGLRNNVRSCIKRIRAKFLAIDPTFDRIENFAAFGYRWK